MSTRRGLDGAALGFMLLLCVVWSLQQISLKVGTPDVAPLMMIALRSGLAAGFVAIAMRLSGERLDLSSGRWRPGLLAGLLFALEFLLVGEALRHTLASHVGIFLYTAPVFAALGLHWKLPAERLRPFQWAGIATAFVGVAITFLGRETGGPSVADGASLGGDLLALMAGACWGATTVVIRCSRLSNAPATETLLYQLLCAFAVLLVSAIGLGQARVVPTPAFWAQLAFQSFIVSFASFLMWFWLLRRYLASRLGVLSFMTPVFGVAFGVWLLGERLSLSFVAGGVLVLAGLLTVTGGPLLASVLARLRGGGSPGR